MNPQRKSIIPIARIFERNELWCRSYHTVSHSKIPTSATWMAAPAIVAVVGARTDVKVHRLEAGAYDNQGTTRYSIFYESRVSVMLPLFSKQRERTCMSCVLHSKVSASRDGKISVNDMDYGHETLRTSHFLASAQSMWTPHFVAQERVVQLKHSTQTSHCLATTG